MKITYQEVNKPQKDAAAPVLLSDETMKERKEKILARMRQHNLDQLVIYDDVEHANNFMYLTGFFTRFEEALLILNQDGTAVLALGNENLNKCGKSRLEADPVHVSLFSLPNQPNRKDCTLKQLLAEAGIGADKRIGIVGWKLFTSVVEENKRMFDVPAYIVETIREIAGNAQLVNATALFIGEDGARVTNNANEIAHYEYGAALASDCMLDAMDKLEAGVSELELGDALVRSGQHTSVVTIAASGPRFVKANMFPTDNRVKVGDPISLTVGYAGGSSSRSGYAVHTQEELPAGCEEYLDRVAKPYFGAYATWLENIRIGMKGDALFQKIEEVLPRSEYHWGLCPGHLVAEEEWLCSPVYEGSSEVLRSGMIFQIDIIPSVPGYGGVCAESTVVLADEALKKELREQYPELYGRMQARAAYLRQELHINLSEDVLPMCSTVGYLRPYLLNKGWALAVAQD
ncbi:M24 family metallopeptidase [Gehongia tenuis]|uniref:M24 family metallopeptidase n=1 Tax=Gehongia tenuis TaxID=2763655 RepID=A0A926HLI1_9FIRM|nr:aminopeptidase P family protein [Gehongia tenuis]MBC8532097.1 M24 family metallopeptidase [Gehongia tenuis]